ncbi:MAG: DUF4242 domain-containing protein [Cyclobacteriaceae bacterium]|nr:DUF4242 domain-containing protein [Cyclobacteriaceae bacterium]
MPIYMDRHDVSKHVTAENVAQLHQEDLKVQHKFKCRGLTYWFDEQRKTAFCLIEAPNKQALQDMHNHAHGEVPHRIIEVDINIVESFLGRIEDPEMAQNAKLNIINDPAFRTLAVYEAEGIRFNGDSNKIIERIKEFEGSIVKHTSNFILTSFVSVTQAVQCALSIDSELDNESKLNIGIGAGVPVTDEEVMFQSTIEFAEKACWVQKKAIVTSKEVRDLYKSENANIFPKGNICSLGILEADFLEKLFEFIEENWQNPEIVVEDFGKNIGLSKSQLFRKIKSMLGIPPNTFLRDYRLKKALEIIKDEEKDVSEITFMVGFNSRSYFSKRFGERYGISPRDLKKKLTESEFSMEAVD